MISSSLRTCAFCVVGLVAVSALSGCHVTTNKNGKKENVDIGTPFGSMSVKTDDDTVNASLGITAYPGAVVVHDGKGKDDNGSADVNMSFGNFHLGVIARSFQSSDKPDKVFAFYRKDLARYGEVIQCDGNKTLGSPARTSQGLSCDESEKRHISNGDHGDGIELRSGSPAHQRIVAVEDKDGGSRIALIKLDLPTDLHSHDSKESE